MAHNLSTRLDGRVMMAYADRSPWHGLGTAMAPTSDVHEAMRAASLDWSVTLAPAYRQVNTSIAVPEFVAIQDRRVVEREDGTYLATVGTDYTLLQNADAFEILEPVCREHGIVIATAGAIDEGRKVWMLAKMPGSIEPMPGDTVNGYFLVTTGHDGGTACTARFTPIRVVCQNTLNAAMGAKGADIVKIRHSASASIRVAEARKLATAMIGAMATTGETFQQLAERTWNPATIAEYITRVFPADADGKVTDVIKQRRRDVSALVFSGQGAELAGATTDGTGQATAWAAYNAVTEYLDHVRPAQAVSTSAVRKAETSALFGNGVTVKASALSIARQLVTV